MHTSLTQIRAASKALLQKNPAQKKRSTPTHLGQQPISWRALLAALIIVWCAYWSATQALLTPISQATGSTPTHVIISELFPAPSAGQNEWIELFNPTQQSISLDGWQLWDELSTPSLLLTLDATSLAPGEYRVFTLSASKLNNSADGVRLQDATGQIFDRFSYTSTETGSSWQRTTLTDLSAMSLGVPTPGAGPLSTTSPSPTPSSTPTGTPAPSPSPSPTSTPAPTPVTSPSPTPLLVPEGSILLQSINACPSSGAESLLLLNTTTQVITIDSWQLRDLSGTTRILSGSLPANSTGSLSWSGSVLNNSGDEFSLLTQAGQLIFTARYESCSTGSSLVLVDQEWIPSTDIATPSATPEAAVGGPKISQEQLRQTSVQASSATQSSSKKDELQSNKKLSQPQLELVAWQEVLATQAAVASPTLPPSTMIPSVGEPSPEKLAPDTAQTQLSAHRLLIGGILTLTVLSISGPIAYHAYLHHSSRKTPINLV